MPYPTAVELAEFCVDAKLISGFPVDYTPYERAISAAIATWESDTGWTPFISAGSDDEDVTRTYRRWTTGTMLDFQGGYVSITSVTFDDEATPAVDQTDYYCEPEYGSPKRWMRFLRLPSKVTIVGKPGYSADCPSDVKQALLSSAAAKISTLLNDIGQIVEIRQGDVGYKYAQGNADNPTTQYAQWMADYKGLVARYSRRSFA